MNKFWVGEREACKLILVDFRNEFFVTGCDLGALSREFAVKVCGIGFALDGGLERRWHLAILQRNPIHCAEERMACNDNILVSKTRKY